MVREIFLTQCRKLRGNITSRYMAKSYSHSIFIMCCVSLSIYLIYTRTSVSPKIDETRAKENSFFQQLGPVRG